MTMAERKDKRKQTQKQQAAATPKLHPRGLARSVAKTLGGGKVRKNWREQVAKLPRTLPFKKKPHYRDCVGHAGGQV